MDSIAAFLLPAVVFAAILKLGDWLWERRRVRKMTLDFKCPDVWTQVKKMKRDLDGKRRVDDDQKRVIECSRPI